jgi:hypothetical protein
MSHHLMLNLFPSGDGGKGERRGWGEREFKLFLVQVTCVFECQPNDDLFIFDIYFVTGQSKVPFTFCRVWGLKGDGISRYWILF